MWTTVRCHLTICFEMWRCSRFPFTFPDLTSTINIFRVITVEDKLHYQSRANQGQVLPGSIQHRHVIVLLQALRELISQQGTVSVDVMRQQGKVECLPDQSIAAHLQTHYWKSNQSWCCRKQSSKVYQRVWTPDSQLYSSPPSLSPRYLAEDAILGTRLLHPLPMSPEQNRSSLLWWYNLAA